MLSDYAKISSIMANKTSAFKVGFAQLSHLVAFCLALAFVIIAFVAAFEIERFYRDKFLPGSFINTIDVSNLTETEALAKLTTLNKPPLIDIELLIGHEVATLSAEQVAAHYDNQTSIQNLIEVTNSLPWHSRYLKALGFGEKSDHPTQLYCDSPAITTAITDLAKRVYEPQKYPSVSLGVSGNKNTLKVDPGKLGIEVDATASAALIAKQCAPHKSRATLYQTLAIIPPPTLLNPEEIKQLSAKAEKIVGKSLALKVQNHTFYLNDQQLVGFLAGNSTFDTTKIDHAVAAIGSQILAEPADAIFEYDPDSLKVTKFVPPRDGLVIDKQATTEQITQAIAAWQTDSPLAETQQQLNVNVNAKKPAITLDKTNNLGINELVGYGDSAYAHSIPTRVHNVALTAQKINYTIIKPGEEFSFNQTLGEVSRATGFQPAYVIKAGRTELGDGGGVCQVSSTLFRAAMNAGLNITRRRPHSYRVSYYELNSKAGFDATVYAGEVDFRFKNDTPGHLLLYTQTDSKNLTMKIEIYGTSDGRVSEISDYKSWDARPPAATQYIDDPSLPPGKLKQIDWSAPGLKTSFVYTVKDKFGTVKQQETYYSNYLPWSAKFLRGPG